MAESKADERREAREVTRLERELRTEGRTVRVDARQLAAARAAKTPAEAKAAQDAIARQYADALNTANADFRAVVSEAVTALAQGMSEASASWEAALAQAQAAENKITLAAQAAYSRQLDLAAAAREAVVRPAANDYLNAVKRLAADFDAAVSPARDAHTSETGAIERERREAAG